LKLRNIFRTKFSTRRFSKLVSVFQKPLKYRTLRLLYMPFCKSDNILTRARFVKMAGFQLVPKLKSGTALQKCIPNCISNEKYNHLINIKDLICLYHLPTFFDCHIICSIPKFQVNICITLHLQNWKICQLLGLCPRPPFQWAFLPTPWSLLTDINLQMPET
jgi:hypothetical protein